MNGGLSAGTDLPGRAIDGGAQRALLLGVARLASPKATDQNPSEASIVSDGGLSAGTDLPDRFGACASRRLALGPKPSDYLVGFIGACAGLSPGSPGSNEQDRDSDDSGSA